MVQQPDPSLINEDIRPTTEAERHWSTWDMASLWIGMVVCVPTYMLAGGLIGQGMSAWQAIFTVALGNIIVLVPMILNGHPGAKYGIPFPVLARAAFGIHGAHVPSLVRAAIACGWFGIQTWVGGSAIYQLVDAIPGVELAGADLPILGINPAELVCFLLFWGIQVYIIYKGVESIRLLERFAAPVLIVAGLALLGWAWMAAGSLGEMMASPSQFGPGGTKEGQFWSVFFPSLTAMVGFWATLSLNIPDFTRYSVSQRAQVLGQALGLPTTMTLFSFIGVAVTSATPLIFRDPVTGALGDPIWDPTLLLGKLGGGISVLISLFALSIATLSTNIAANVVSPANALINAAPQRVTFRLGGYVTALIGMLMMPWKLVEDPNGYIFIWLVGVSALLGPVGGILVADYYVLRRRILDLDGLYRFNGPYWYRGGFNLAALLAFVLAVLPSLPGFLQTAKLVDAIPEVFGLIYQQAWLVGFALAGVLYLILMKVMHPSQSSAE